MKKMPCLHWVANLLLATGFLFLIPQLLIAQTPKSGPLNVCYVEVNNNNILNVGAYKLKNGGQQLFDVAIIFAANINWDAAQGKAVLFNNDKVSIVVNNKNTYIKPLQDKGIKVLLDVLGNHGGVGICNFTSRASARDFAQQCADAVTAYGLDGIDLDDEFADYGTNGRPAVNDSSFVMLVQELRSLMPTKIISFYAWGPAYSRQAWGGFRAGDYVNYSWNASYGFYNVPVVPPLSKPNLGPAATWINSTSVSTAKTNAQRTVTDGYGVYLCYDLHGYDESNYLSAISTGLYNDSTVLASPIQAWPPVTPPATSAGARSLNFSGTKYVDAGAITLSGAAISMEGWIKPSAFKTTSPYISTIMGTEVSSGNAALLRFGDANIPTGNKLQFVLSNGTAQIKLTSKTAFTTNTWYHVAATYDGSQMKMYINGTLDTAISMTGSFVSTGSFYISKSWDNTRTFTGLMDELRVWKKALTQTEVQTNMCYVNPASTSLEAYWRLNEGAGTSTLDTTGHAHTGTLVNMASTDWSTTVPTNCVVVTLPVAGFSGNPTNITTGQGVSFINSSTNATAYTWTFSGGTPATSTSTNPVVTYNTAGTYTVKLVATNAGGSDSVIKTNYITVTNPAANRSISFSGTNQYLNAGTVNLSGAALSLEGWVKPAAFKTASPYITTIMGIESGTNTALLRFGDANIPAGNKLQFVLSIGGVQKKLVSNTTFVTGTWYYVVATYDGVNMNIYVNGNLDATIAQTGAVTANAAFNIGYSWDLTRCMNGIIDEARVWKRALTSTEIQINMCTVPVNSASLEAYYKMNETTGTVAIDTTGHLHNATFVNMTVANRSTDVPATCGGLASRPISSKLSTEKMVQNDDAIAYPNPVKKGNDISITVKNVRSLSMLSIFNATGKQIETKKIVNNITRISTTGLASGLYYYSIRSEKGLLLDKGSFIIQ